MKRSLLTAALLVSTGCGALDLWDPAVVDVESRPCTQDSQCDTVEFRLPDALASDSCVVPVPRCDVQVGRCTVDLTARDTDGDNYRDQACADQVPQFEPARVDCVDDDADAFPDADQDGDGFIRAGCGGEDCDDRIPTVVPATAANPVEACDGYVSVCVGSAPPVARPIENADGDGFAPLGTTDCVDVLGGSGQLISLPRTDCDDDDQYVFPGAPDVCDGRANDCGTGIGPDPLEDPDHDEFTAPGSTACLTTLPGRFPATDCDDSDGNSHPGAPEVCDGKFNDCAVRATSGVARVVEDPDQDGAFSPEAPCVGAAVSIECTSAANDATTRFCPPRVEQSIRSTAGNVTDMLSVDLDGDGIGEVLTSEPASAGCANGRIVITARSGQPLPSFGTVVPSEAGCLGVYRNLTAVDYDGDGRLEVLASIANVGVYAFEVVENASTTTPLSLSPLNGQPILTSAAFPGGAAFGGQSFAVAQLDADPDLEIAFVDGSGNLVHRGVSDSVVAVPNVQVGPAPVAANAVQAADVDGDGDVDLVSHRTNSGIVLVSLNAGNGTFGAALTAHMLPAGNVAEIAVGDVAGAADGRIDVVVRGSTRGLVVITSSGSGASLAFSAVTVSVPSGELPLSRIQVADLGRDGPAEIVYAQSGTDRVSYVDEIGSGIFATHDIVTDFDGAALVGASDLDGDGDLDVSAFNNFVPRGIVWWRSDFVSNPVFVPNNVDRAFNGVDQVVLADADLDGRLDIYAAASSANQLTVWRSRVASATSFDERSLSDAFTSGGGATLDTPVSLVVGQVLGSAHPDTVVVETAQDRVRILQNLGTADLQHAALTITSTVVGPRAAVLADLDGDDASEVIVAGHGLGGANGTLTAFTAAADGQSFTSRSLLTAALACDALAVVNLDGDGDLDLLAVCGGSLTAFHNPGGPAGAFVAVDLGAPDGNIVRLAVGDLDRDGNVDAVTATDADSVLHAVLLDRDGAVLERIDVTTGLGSIAGLALGDVDVDGDLDFVVGSGVVGNEIVLVQCVAVDRPRYIVQPLSGARNNVSAIAIGLLDADTFPDVAAVMLNDSDVVWWATGGTPWWNH